MSANKIKSNTCDSFVSQSQIDDLMIFLDAGNDDDDDDDGM